MLNRLMTSRKVRGFLLSLLILSAVAAAISVALPLNRKQQAISSLGDQSLSQAGSLAMAVEYYNGPRLQSLIDYPGETAYYQSLCAFLAQAKQEMGYDKAYLLYQNEQNQFCYLADADYFLNERQEESYQPIGREYGGERYGKKCFSLLSEQFAGRKQAAYVPEILDGDYIVSYLPLKDARGEVTAVLGVDAKLSYSDFTRYGPIDFEQVTTISGIVFLISLILFVLCMDKGLSEEEKENRWRKRRGLPPKPVKKDNIVVDTLDDIDPNDYL